MTQDVTFHDKRLLLVEDELFLAEKIEKQLSALGVKEVLIASCLAEATQHAEAEKIDLALLDVNLPDNETTVEFGKSLADAQIPIVFFSGYNVDDMSKMAEGHEFLEKPLSVPRLKAGLQRAMLRSSASSADDPEEKMAGQEARQ